MRKLLVMVPLVIAAVALVVGISISAIYTDDDGDYYDDVKTLIDQNKVGEQLKLDANDKLGIPTDPNDGVTYQLGTVEVDASTGAVTIRNEGLARFHMPVKSTHNDKSVVGKNELAVYTGTSYDIALDASQSGFSSYVVVRDATAPTEYQFRVELPGGAKLSEDGNGGIEILNQANDVVGTVALPWAVDANGEVVSTEFKLRAGLLVQTIEHNGASYPVVADPNVTYGWAVYVRWDDMAESAEDNVEDAEDWVGDITTINCTLITAGIVAGLGALLTPGTGVFIGAAYCATAMLAEDDANDALEEIEDVLLEDGVTIPGECTLMLRLMYLGLIPSRVELEDCGSYTGEYYRLGG